MNRSKLSVPFWQMAASAEQKHELEDALRRVVDSGWFILGPEVEAFESEMAAFVGAEQAVGVGNGTDAIALSLLAEGVGVGDEVITSPMTAAFTALAVNQIGAKPVFADVDPTTLHVNAESIAERLTDKTRAILPVHLYGHVCDINSMEALASSHAIPLIEDACQAHGARRGGQFAGTVGVLGAFSFYPTKNLGALGDGGMIVTDDRERADELRRLRNGGQQSRYRHVSLGINSRLDEMQAAVLRVRLARLEEENRRRALLAERYVRAFTSVPLRVVLPEPDVQSAWHLFVVQIPERDRLAKHLANDGIGSLIHYPIPVHRQPAYESNDTCPNAEVAADSILSLPLYPSLSDADQQRVIASVVSFFA